MGRSEQCNPNRGRCEERRDGVLFDHRKNCVRPRLSDDYIADAEIDCASEEAIKLRTVIKR